MVSSINSSSIFNYDSGYTSMLSSSSTSDNTDVTTLFAQLQKKVSQNFADSFSKEDKSKEKNVDDKVKSVMSLADKDNNGQVSKSELSGLDKTNMDSDTAQIVSNLISNFDSYDKNGDSELSVGELKDALKTLKKDFSLRELSKIAEENKENVQNISSTESEPSSLSGVSSYNAKLISNYGLEGGSNSTCSATV